MADLDDSDAFSPVKCARRALLNNDAWVTPEKNSQTKSYAADNSLDLMKPCGISPDNDKKALGGLYDAGRSLVVWKEGTKELVPSALCFLAKASNCGSTKICQIISRLFKAAHVLDVATAELRTRKRTTPLGGENLGVFVRSLAVRALDCAIIKSLNSAGFLESEQAGAIFAAGYEKKIPIAKHVTDFFAHTKGMGFRGLRGSNVSIVPETYTEAITPRSGGSNGVKDLHQRSEILGKNKKARQAVGEFQRRFQETVRGAHCHGDITSSAPDQEVQILHRRERGRGRERERGHGRWCIRFWFRI